MARWSGSGGGRRYEHYDDEGRWTGWISDADIEGAATETAVSFCGPAGTVVIMDSWTIHGSRRNDSDKGRPQLVTGYAAAPLGFMCDCAHGRERG